MRRFFQLLLACVVIAFISQPALCSIDISIDVKPGDHVVFSDPGSTYRTGLGGPFIGKINNDNTNTWWTFCVEADGSVEWITFGTSYTVLNLQKNLATATKNVATNAAKWLYYAYGHDLLSGFNNNQGYVNNAANNVNLQKAIWSLVVKNKADADPNSYPSYNPTGYWLDAGNLGNASDTTSAAYLREIAIDAVDDGPNDPDLVYADRIAVLNPGSSESSQNQSMLYEVPEPVTIIIWSLLGLCGCFAVCWRWRKRIA